MILAGVSINVLFGDNGFIAKAQQARIEWEEASQKEQREIAAVFGRNYVEYNGQLDIEYASLVNQYGEKVILRGMSAGSGKGIESLDEKYYNKTSLSTIKD